MPTTDRLAARPTGLDPHGAMALARRPWTLRCAGADLRVRGAVPADLARLARLHGRCSADTLLQRYLAGGRAPSLAVLTALLAEPLVLLAQAAGGEVVAVASGLRAPLRPGERALPARALSFGLIVEDAWQRRGVGTALAAHLAAGAHLLGARELVTETAATTLPLRRVLDGIGPTRGSRGAGGSHLRTRLDVSTLSGLGSLGEVLAG